MYMCTSITTYAEGSRITITRSELGATSRSTLTINPLVVLDNGMYDNGTYECVAENNRGSSRDFVEVDILCKYGTRFVYVW